MNSDDINASIEATNAVRFDSKKLALLCRSVLGTKSIQAFCEETKLSRSLVSRLLNGNLVAPPSIRSIYRLAGSNNPKMIDEMLKACGYPAAAVEYLAKFRNEPVGIATNSEKDLCAITIKKPAGLLTMLVEQLESLGYGKQFNIDYRTPNLFAICSAVDGWTLACIPALCDDNDTEGAWKRGVQGLAKAITLWNDQTVYFLFTNSAAARDRLKLVPNLAYKVAILNTSDGVSFDDQIIIPPLGTNVEEGNGDGLKFPVNLVCRVTSGKKSNLTEEVKQKVVE